MKVRPGWSRNSLNRDELREMSGMSRSTPIPLVFCITELDLGGAESALTQLVVHLDRNEWQPHVICLGRSGHFVPILEAAGIPVICLNATGALSLPRVLLELIRHLRRIRPALVQTFLSHANLLGRFAAWFARGPVVVSGLRVAEHQSRWHGVLDRWTNRLVSMNVCVSRGVAVFSEKQVGLAAEKLRVIPNAVDINRFACATPVDLRPLGIPDSSRVLITIGRLHRQKGIDVLIESIRRLDPLPDDVHFLIVGTGPERDRLQQQVQAHHLESKIHFSGARQDVPQLLASSAALILPSRWEGMPNVVLEAMAAGLPVVCTAVEGVDELIVGGENGLVANVEDPIDLATKLQAIFNSEIDRNRARAVSKEIVMKDFTIESIVEKYSALYQNLIAQSRPVS